MLLCVCLFTISCIVGSREICVTIGKQGVSIKEAYFSEKTRSLVECVYSCSQYTECKSIGYNTTSAICYLYTSHTGNVQGSSGTLLFGNMTEDLCDSGKLTKDQMILISRKMGWRDAENACNKAGSRLLLIGNDVSQAAAVKLVKDSGLETIAIGAYRDALKWITLAGDDLVYTAWANDEPAFLGMFAALSRESDYKWKAVNYEKLDGALCIK